MLQQIIFPLSIILFTGTGCTKDSDCPDRKMREQHQNDICTMIYDPVCGCDGKTYGNECEARRNGIRVERKGECE